MKRRALLAILAAAPIAAFAKDHRPGDEIERAHV